MSAITRKTSRKAEANAVSIKKILAQSLREEMQSSKTTIQEVARRLGTGRTSVRRILDESNTSITLSTISRAADAIGLKLVFEAKKMTPAELGKLAAGLPGKSGARAKRLEDDIVARFYGNKTRA